MKRTGDWVFRPNILDEAGGLVEALGTYEPAGKNLTAGFANAKGSILYDSHNRRQSLFLAGTVMEVMGAPGRAEGRGARIHRVMGTINVSPTTWTVGSRFDIGFRFGVFEQDPSSGLILVDANYNMWNAGAAKTDQPAFWANNRQWQHERRDIQTFSDNGVSFVYRFNFPVKRTLKPHECYAVYVETVTGSATVNLWYWLRSFVSDEG